MQTEILTQTQIDFLTAFAKEKSLSSHFYFTGGTPLSAFYLKHRLSEDLDFFSENEIDPLSINVWLQKVKKQLGIKKIDFEQSYNRNLFFLHLKDGVLKTEFTFFPFPRIEKKQEYYGVSTDSIIDIAVNKIFTVYQRTKARDYIDLCFIAKEYGFSFSDLVAKAKIKFDWHIDPIQLGAQFIRAGEVSDWPNMIKKITKKELVDFFMEEAKKLKDEVIK